MSEVVADVIGEGLLTNPPCCLRECAAHMRRCGDGVRGISSHSNSKDYLDEFIAQKGEIGTVQALQFPALRHVKQTLLGRSPSFFVRSEIGSESSVLHGEYALN